MDQIKQAQSRVSDTITRLLTQDRLAGEVLINISREMISNGDFVVDLTWHDDHLTLVAVAEQVIKTPLSELVNDFHHQALHILWRHPFRYSATDDPELVNIACDVAVNQYLPEPPEGTMTLERLSQVLRQRLLANQDSSYYLKILQTMDLNQRQRLTKEIKKTHSSGFQHDHQGWFQQGNQLVRGGRLTKTLRQSVEALPDHQRGLLPQPVQAILDAPTTKFQLPFRRAFWRLAGQVPSGYQPSRARFNRRQPQRLELPGRVTRLISRVYIFIDQSGSMGNQQVSRIIDLINQLSQQADLELLVGDFDAQIQTAPQLVNRRQQLQFERHGGGGTSYQPVFDYLATSHVPKTTPVIIFTDGWGEETVDNHGYRRVLWLLTPKGQLSVANLSTRVIKLEEF